MELASGRECWVGSFLLGWMLLAPCPGLCQTDVLGENTLTPTPTRALTATPTPTRSEPIEFFVSKEGDDSDGRTWETAFSTVGRALSAADQGDRIHIAEGVYREELTLTKKDISLYGGYSKDLQGYSTTLIDPEEHETIISSPGDSFSSEGIPLTIQDADGVLVYGMSFTNGPRHGVRITNSIVTVSNCKIHNNVQPVCLPFLYVFCTGYNGAGLHAIESDLVLLDSVFSSNSTTDSRASYCGPFGSLMPMCFSSHDMKYGGGLYCDNCSSVFLSRCHFKENSSMSFGGAIAVVESDTTIDSCSFSKNYALWGGILEAASSQVNILNSDFHSNNGSSSLLRIHGNSAGVSIRNSDFTGNTCRNSTFFSLRSPTVIIENVMIARNKTRLGSQVYAAISNIQVLHSTLADNQIASGASSASAAIILRNCTSAVFRNNIHWNEVPEFDLEMTDLDISHSLVRGGWTAPSILVEDPRFVDAEMGDYRLGPDSPCIDYGIDAGVATDLLGVARPIDVPGVGQEGTGSEFDLGPYEALATGNPTWTPVPPTPTVTTTLIFDKVVDNRIDSMDLLEMVHEGFSSVSEDAWNSIFHFARYWQFDRN